MAANVKGEDKMNLLDAVNELLKLNKQGVSAHMEGTMSGTQIRLNKDYPDSAPLELWGTKVNDQTMWEYLGMWNPGIDDWQSHSWQVKH
ncbi:hypothetical protein IMAU80188_03062 [Lactiplantibacillus plantarum]|nr:hypothetical protein [Lactiplantibacillus plantarum]MCG0619451.1 hypothetical protein [Lactiplantibacillus plantarum]MCG0807898.1 hypothetical protein [Lactiplantibacillus plantarum]MCG0832708.1 hypothetical protein [Lactiplantibacillus plantarum]MCG0851605.1 hypothetical protein [Lactiplantibacillus plantarum]